jgi:Zn-dependent peptidase ImmA (M78 family)
MASEGIPVNPAIIQWARVRAGLTLDEATEKFRRFPEWENGEALPTYPQLESLSEELKLPIAAFFFPEPPRLPPIRESFRTLPDAEFDRLPRQVRFLLRKAKALQLNLAELTQGVNPAPRFITRDLAFPVTISSDVMAARVREYLGVTLDRQFAWNSPDNALKDWRDIIQGVGIFVFKDAFRSEDYCGFSIYDDIFPLIYINNSTTKTRQIFTLFHELGHILFHTSGVDTDNGINSRALNEQQQRIEILCNRFASHCLVPDNAFNAALEGRDHSRQTAEYLAARFQVSREVIYRRFLDRRWIMQDEYRSAVQEWNGQRQAGGGSGGNHYYTKLAYLGREYVGLVLKQYHQDRISEAQLAQYLETKPRNVATLEEYFLAGSQRRMFLITRLFLDYSKVTTAGRFVVYGSVLMLSLMMVLLFRHAKRFEKLRTVQKAHF